MNKCYSFRRIIFETASALHAGSGKSDPVQDMPVQLDVNGLPVINASSITGSLRHLYKGDVKSLFGDVNQNGSRIFVENAVVLDENCNAAEGLSVNKNSEYLQKITRLVQRDHCKLNHLGSAEKNAKFDRTVLIAGIRFMCEFSILAESREKAAEEADEIIKLWASPMFRLGGGSRNGFGKVTLKSIQGKEYDLSDTADKKAFLARSSSYKVSTGEEALDLPAQGEDPRIKTWKCTLTPEDFWLTAAGYPEQVDITPKFEEKVIWDEAGGYTFCEYPLLPATSIKGALAHRCAYYYNKLKKIFADEISLDEFEKPNPAVIELFGEAKDSKNNIAGRVGRVLISDIYCEETKEKLFNHVKIDRFTGGALDGALFTERVNAGGKLQLEIFLLEGDKNSNPDPDIEKAFELALQDIFTGALPLGGGTMRGLGAMKKTGAEA